MTTNNYELTHGVSFRDDRSPKPVFTITHEVIRVIGCFRRLNPDIDEEFFNHQLNATLLEMVDRINDEFNGQMISGLALEGRSDGTQQ